MRATVAVLLLCLGAAGLALSEPSDPAVVKSIPGVTAADTHPEACVGCHTRMDDIGLDARLSTALREWEREVPAKVMEIAEAAMESGADLLGRHPPVPLPLRAVPSSCMGCHESAASAPPFGPLIHLAHYRGGRENHFISIFDGACTHCHKMNPSTGRWRIPDGSEP